MYILVIIGLFWLWLDLIAKTIASKQVPESQRHVGGILVLLDGVATSFVTAYVVYINL